MAKRRLILFHLSGANSSIISTQTKCFVEPIIIIIIIPKYLELVGNIG